MSRFYVNKFRLLALTAACLIFSGCMVGPNFKKPKEEMPANWVEVPKGVSTESAGDLTHWWSIFNDPMLNSLIESAATSNKDLKVAYARIREARAQRAVAVSGQYPTLDSNASYRHSRGSQNASTTTLPPEVVPPTPPNNDVFSGGQDLFLAGFDANFEIDIFGGVRRSVEAATADLAATEEDYQDILITLLSEVAVNYLNVRGSQHRLDIAVKNIEAQRQTLELTEERFKAGLSSELDVSQARAQMSLTESQIPVLDAAARRSMHQLATLLGTTPASLVEQLSRVEPIPGVPPEVPVGLPSEILRRRPDVRRAEKQLAAATARIGVATADLFPRFSLTGNLAQSSISFSDMALGSSTAWSLGPTIRWNIFNAGRTRANIEVQNARTEQALGIYEKAVLTALEEVETALVSYSREQDRRAALASAVQSNQRAHEISSELYARGLVDFLRVLESQRSLYLSQDQLAASDQLVSANLVALYKALGGGWLVTGS